MVRGQAASREGRFPRPPLWRTEPAVFLFGLPLYLTTSIVKRCVSLPTRSVLVPTTFSWPQPAKP